MGDFMAVIAFWELGHDARGMGLPVALLAFGHYPVLQLMAERAIKRMVLCLTRAEQLKRRLVTPRTKL